MRSLFPICRALAEQPSYSLTSCLVQASDFFKFSTSVKTAAPNQKLDVQVDGQTVSYSRPPSAYNLFVKEHFHNIKSQTPEAKAPEVLKLVAQKFKELKADDLKKYTDEVDRIKQALATARDQHSEAAKNAKADAKAAKSAANSVKYTNHYSTFVKEKFAVVREANATLTTKEVMKKIAEQWSELSQAEKNKLKEAAMRQHGAQLLNTVKAPRGSKGASS